MRDRFYGLTRTEKSHDYITLEIEIETLYGNTSFVKENKCISRIKGTGQVLEACSFIIYRMLIGYISDIDQLIFIRAGQQNSLRASTLFVSYPYMEFSLVSSKLSP